MVVQGGKAHHELDQEREGCRGNPFEYSPEDLAVGDFSVMEMGGRSWRRAMATVLQGPGRPTGGRIRKR